jgi:hypothetical protein
LNGSSRANAVAAAIPQAWPTVACPIPARLDNICMNIGSQSLASKSEPFSYVFQRKFYEAACVIVGVDDEETEKAKIRKMWSASKHRLTCTDLQFDVQDGNILKYAVSKKFGEFLEEAIWWGVDLNWMDKSDGRTVLDYVKYQIDRNKGQSIERKLQHYYKILREAGAKHKSEL